MNPPWRRRLLLILRLLFVAALVFTLMMTLWPHPTAHPKPLVWFKLGDCIAFALLTLVATIAFPQVRLLRLGEYLSFLAAVVEALQGLASIGRDANIFDWMIETCVISLVLLASSSPRPGKPDRPPEI